MRSRATPWNWRRRSTRKMSRWVQLNVLRSPNAEEQTSITFYNFDRKLSIWYDTQGVVCLDGSRSSTLSGRLAQAAGDERSWSGEASP